MEIERNGRLIHLLHTELPPGASTIDFVEDLHRGYGNEIATADALIVRLPIGMDEDDVDLEPFRQRSPQRVPLYFLYLNDFKHVLTENKNPVRQSLIDTESKASIIAQLRNVEMRRLIHISGALFKKVGSYVYRVPSKFFTSSFLRVGSMAVTRYALDVFAFWLIPHLQSSDVIVTDTWSIATIAFHAAVRLSELERHRAKPCAVLFMSRYHDGSDSAVREFDEVIGAIGLSARKVAFLESASSTGRMMATFRAGIDAAGVTSPIEYVCLYKLGDSDELNRCVYLCDLSETDDEFDFRCIKDAPPEADGVIEIDPVSYFPLHLAVSEVPIKRAATKGSRPMFTEYAGSGVFSVHRDDVDPIAPDRRRHNAIHIDLVKMLETRRFSKRLVTLIESVTSNLAGMPSAIIHPPHDSARKFVAELARRLADSGRTALRVLEHDDMERQTDNDHIDFLQRLKLDADILIVDDVSITGTRLKQYQRALREHEYQGRIHYIIGVARPDSEDEWETRVRDLRFREGSPLQHEVYAAEYLLLPHWDERFCPWCREQDAYRRGSVPRVVGLRNDVLTDAASKGLTENLFFSVDGKPLPEVKANSLFIGRGGSEADIFTAVASAVQRLRTGAVPGTPKLAGPEYPHVSVLRRGDWIKDTFNDPRLRLSLIRACTAAELTYPRLADEQKRADFARRLLQRSPKFFGFEFAIAALAGKLPRSTFNTAVMEQFDESGREVIKMLLTGSR